MVGKAFAWKAVTASALTAELGRPCIPKGDNKSEKGKRICIGAREDMSTGWNGSQNVISIHWDIY